MRKQLLLLTALTFFLWLAPGFTADAQEQTPLTSEEGSSVTEAEEEQKRLEKEKAEAALEAELQQVDEQLAQLQKETQDRTQAAKEELAQMETELQKARRQNMLFLLGGGVLTLALLILLAVRIRMSGNSGKTKAMDREDE